MLRTYNVLRELARRHRVHLICFDQRHGPDPLTRRRLAENHLRDLCESVSVFEIPAKRSRAVLARTAAASLLRREPFSTRAYWVKPALRHLLEIEQKHRLDVIHIENTLLGAHVAHLPGPARVLVHLNVESDLFRQMATAERNPARRAFLRLESLKMRAFERRIGPSFGAHIACSLEDAARLQAIMGGPRPTVAPNGVDLEFFSPQRDRRDGAPRVVHVGGLNWSPNLQGVSWLIERVWPAVRRTLPNATLSLVGRHGSAPVSRWHGRDGIDLAGEVDDVRPFFAAAASSVVPLHVGGGTRLKILNAWAMGTPVVSTTKGCEGLPARSGENLLVADTPTAFADAVLRLLREPELRNSLSAAGRRLVETEFGWPAVVDRIEAAYRLAMERA